jgi:hypothetical protein
MARITPPLATVAVGSFVAGALVVALAGSLLRVAAVILADALNVTWPVWVSNVANIVQILGAVLAAILWGGGRLWRDRRRRHRS